MLKTQSNHNASNQKRQIKLQYIPENDFENQVQTRKKSKLKKNISHDPNRTKPKMGHWSFQEKLRYVIFVENNSQTFSRQHISKLWKLFKQMGQFINTRHPYQCRSHHQKIVKKFYNVDDMIQCLKSAFNQGALRKAQRRYVDWFNNEVQQKIAFPKLPSQRESLIKSEFEEKSEVSQSQYKKTQPNLVIKAGSQIQHVQRCSQQAYQTEKLLLNELYQLEELYIRQLLLNSILVQRASYNFTGAI